MELCVFGILLNCKKRKNPPPLFHNSSNRIHRNATPTLCGLPTQFSLTISKNSRKTKFVQENHHTFWLVLCRRHYHALRHLPNPSDIFIQMRICLVPCVFHILSDTLFYIAHSTGNRSLPSLYLVTKTNKVSWYSNCDTCWADGQCVPVFAPPNFAADNVSFLHEAKWV